MKPILVLLFLASAAGNPFSGRWDLTLTPQNGQAPWPQWMELVESGGTPPMAARPTNSRLPSGPPLVVSPGIPQVRVQPRGGGVFSVTDIKTEGSHLTLGVSRNVTWELDVTGDHITGTQKGSSVATIAGVRAPIMKHPMPKAWTAPEPIFNGKDLTGWEPTAANAANNWVAENGVLLNKEHGANLKTTRKFDDFKLHIEYNCPDEGNSGIYLRGRYEIQVAYEKPGVNDRFHDMGSIYGFIPAATELPRKPGEWETFDVTLVGRHVTVVRNGVKTIDNKELPGITGGALDSNEGEPGPFYLQGDHTGGMKYRNITVSVPK